LGILKDSKKFLKKVGSGKMTMEEYQTKIGRASQQILETERFALRLKELV